jgi:uncharacterized protein YbjT (DUF2867 family)
VVAQGESGTKIVVCGATGRQGGAVVRHLLRDGWKVVGLTRDAHTAKAAALATAGADVVQADMAEPASLAGPFSGAHGVFSVQNPMLSGFAAEVQQGKAVADAARAAGVQHLVYGAAGIGQRTGVPSWDTKVEVETYLRDLDLPVTVLRPNAFMELMSDKAYYPPVAIWHVMVKLMGGGRNVPWLAVDDVGAIAARVFADRERFIGRQIQLASDVTSLDETRALWSDVFGKPPSRFPLPVWLFERVAGHAGKDLPVMWRWLRTHEIPEDTAPTREIHPRAMSLRGWMLSKKAEAEARA